MSLPKDSLACYFESVKHPQKKKVRTNNKKLLLTFFLLIGGTYFLNALIRGNNLPNPFYFFKKMPESSVETPVPQASGDIVILKDGNATQEGMLSLIQEVMTSKYIEISDSENFSYQNCHITAIYKGITYESNYYARMQSTIDEGSSEEDCSSVNAQSIFAETYLVDGVTYNRQSTSLSFDTLNSETKAATAHIPFNYIVNLFGNLKSLTPTHTTIEDSGITVETNMEKTDVTGTYVFHLDPSTLSIISVDYTLDSLDGTKSVGSLTLNWNPSEITNPQ